MWHLSKIREDYRPEIVSSDVSDDKFYTFKNHKIAFAFRARVNISVDAYDATDDGWNGDYWNDPESAFRKMIENNFPCVIMYKVKNFWAPKIDTVVCFMTGDLDDVFLVHPKDLIEWDPNKKINK